MTDWIKLKQELNLDLMRYIGKNQPAKRDSIIAYVSIKYGYSNNKIRDYLSAYRVAGLIQYHPELEAYTLTEQGQGAVQKLEKKQQ